MNHVNLKYFGLKIFEEKRYLISTHKNTGIQSKLFFDFKNEFVKLNKKIEEKEIEVRYFSLFMGVVEYRGFEFMVFVEEVEQVGKVQGSFYYSIESIVVIAVQNVNLIIQQEIEKIMRNFQHNFYFSFQKQQYDIMEELDFNYCYNFQQFMKRLKNWVIPVFMGYLKTKELIFDQVTLQYTILIRYSIDKKIVQIYSLIEDYYQNKVYNNCFYLNFDNKKLINNKIYDKKILILSTNEKDLQLQSFEKTIKQLQSQYKNIKYHYCYQDMIQNKNDMNKYYGNIEVIRKFVIYFSQNQSSEQQLYFIIQQMKEMNISSFYCIFLILFEILKQKLYFYNVIIEHQPYNFYQFFDKTMFNFLDVCEQIQSRMIKIFSIKDYFFDIINKSQFYLEKVQKKQEQQKLNLLIISYNVSGIDPLENNDELKNFFDHINQQNMDIIVFGIQEIMELKFKFKNLQSMMKTMPLIEKWIKVLSANLQNYEVMEQQNLIGLQLFILKNKKFPYKIKVIESNEVKLGMMGFGNKGCIQKIIQIQDTKIELINCHLYPGFGPEAIKNRSQDLHDILEEKNNYLFKKQVDYTFIFGDTNFKINEPKEKVVLASLKDPNCFQIFCDRDEYIYNKEMIPEFSKFQEFPITFPPTYKYNKKTFDFHEGKRTPSWTDRIFFKFKKQFDVTKYESLRLFISDHFPVLLHCHCFIEK